MYGNHNLLSVTAAGEEPGSGCRESKPRSGDGDLREGPRGCLNGNHRREQFELSRQWEKSSQIDSSRVGIFLYIIVVELVV
ncbi:hypothetical protein Zmor_001407 [Zophobas morio]|uniref:Uncharacterized protein n=1 Tax=Zophobas morio TaxID=2755281 RepID=A0AA38J3I7_9CUCU|nr:hypothetical protein Zmor_001407 [Zophobas morio]